MRMGVQCPSNNHFQTRVASDYWRKPTSPHLDPPKTNTTFSLRPLSGRRGGEGGDYGDGDVQLRHSLRGRSASSPAVAVSMPAYDQTGGLRSLDGFMVGFWLDKEAFMLGEFDFRAEFWSRWINCPKTLFFFSFAFPFFEVHWFDLGIRGCFELGRAALIRRICQKICSFIILMHGKP